MNYIYILTCFKCMLDTWVYFFAYSTHTKAFYGLYFCVLEVCNLSFIFMHTSTNSIIFLVPRCFQILHVHFTIIWVLSYILVCFKYWFLFHRIFVCLDFFFPFRAHYLSKFIRQQLYSHIIYNKLIFEELLNKKNYKI